MRGGKGFVRHGRGSPPPEQEDKAGMLNTDRAILVANLHSPFNPENTLTHTPHTHALRTHTHCTHTHTRSLHNTVTVGGGGHVVLKMDSRDWGTGVVGLWSQHRWKRV